ncbi:transcriptional regulator, ArsR family [Wenxinia saemankumensis]|uniref:Transcriptional regulator, ArsR family n=2 Tax=Wenxinia saemankumensis TaxID=1447782 RepID=A0A1M6ERH7_9RHOB|nr:transcriptional regulator, ArsR family [Wenxinia saemankumensis]
MVSAQLGQLSNPIRLLVLCKLAGGEMSVGALQAELGLGQSALSQHLARLREAGMVATRRAGTTIHYRIADPRVARLMMALDAIYCRPEAGTGPGAG